MATTLDNVLVWVTSLITDAFTSMFGAVQAILVGTPDVTELPQVRYITDRTIAVLDVVFALAFLAAGAVTMFAGGDEHSRYTTRMLMPRMVVAFAGAHFAPLICAKLIGLVDAVGTGLTGGQPTTLSALSAVQAQLGDGDGVSVLLFAVLAALVTVLFAAVALSFVTRLGVLVLIAISGPLALACHALPQTDDIAKLWWRALAGCLLVPLAQGLTLQTGQQVLLDPHAQGFLFGTPGGGVVNLLIVIALLSICVKIPGLVRRYVMRTPRRGFGTQVLRLVAIRHTVRVLTRRSAPTARPARRGDRTTGDRP